ncbi:MAG TPA: hypothetical protein VES95_07110 [Dermatophilaceae bacterium]|nr:hypothetical protein [Dermatophilaceae bacterium]
MKCAKCFRRLVRCPRCGGRTEAGSPSACSRVCSGCANTGYHCAEHDGRWTG